MQDAASNLLARWAKMKSDRQTWMVQWDQVARYCCPRKGNILSKQTAGNPQTQDLYDTTAEEAGGIFAAGCVTHICPAGEKWLRLEAKKGNGKDVPPTVAEWYDRATDRVMDIIYNSNFYENIHEDFFDSGHFGTSCLMADEDPDELVNFINIPVGSFAIQENCRGRVDTVGREWQWTALQASEKWGADKLGPQQRKALKESDATKGERLFTYVQLIEPRKRGEYVDGSAAAADKRRIRSVYLCIEDAQIIEDGGFYSMPAFVNRLLRSNQEVYGRGPGIQKLPDVRIINTMVRDFLIAAEKLANPPWLLGDDQSTDLDNRPNGTTYWDSTNPASKPEQIQLKNRLDYLQDTIDKQRGIIKKGYYNDLFQMLSNLEEMKREKTAYEVQQMVAEKLLLFSPLFGRITREKLNPCVERVFDIAARASHLAWAQGQDGVLPLPPPELQDFATFNPVYVSKIALAIKAAENQSFATMLALVEQAAPLDPSVVQVLDLPEGIRRVARNVGLPAKLIRTQRDVDQRMAAMQAAQQQAAAPEQSEMATRAVKNLGPQAQNAAMSQMREAQEAAAAAA